MRLTLTQTFPWFGISVIAVFMPCFMSQQPAGMQVYLCTSFLFTLAQGGALRNDALRQKLGLPKMYQRYEAELAKEFMELKMLEKKAQEMRGDGPLLGKGVLAMGLETSFAGTHRPSTIVGSNPTGGPLPEYTNNPTTTPVDLQTPLVSLYNDDKDFAQLYQGPFVHGISASPQEMQSRRRTQLESSQHETTTKPSSSRSSSVDEYMPDISDKVMEAANRGEMPVEIQMAPISTKTDSVLDAKRFLARKRNRRTKKPRTK